MRRFYCPRLHSNVELTRERLRHIRERHPALVGYAYEIPEALAHPDAMRRSTWTASTWLFLRWLPKAHASLVVVVVSPPAFASLPWIITAYLSKHELTGPRVLSAGRGAEGVCAGFRPASFIERRTDATIDESLVRAGRCKKLR